MRRWLSSRGDTDRSSGVADAVIKESFHDWAVLLEVKPVELIFEVGPVLGSDCADEVDVLIGVESGKVLLVGVVVM